MSSYPKHSSESNNHASSNSPLDASERTPLISKTSSPQLPQPSPPSYTSNTSSSSYVTANDKLDRPPSPANSIATITPSRVATTSPVSTPGPAARKSLSTDLPVSHPLYYGHDDGEGGGSGEEADESCQARLSSSYLSIRELALREFKILLRYSGPVVLTYVLQNSMQLASLVSLGHLGSIGKNTKRFFRPNTKKTFVIVYPLFFCVPLVSFRHFFIVGGSIFFFIGHSHLHPHPCMC